ncbi:MAG: hypothetical protein IT320_17070 [Anaerolineae bacterium]|nr:hypothetical protein [Anaerolineae bacterium]
MIQPGLSRAVPMGILGFLLGALIVIILRALQGLTPIWDVGVGAVLAVFMGAGFFVWGMGAFDPRMSVHGEAAEHPAEPEGEPKPAALLSSTIWQLSTILIVFMIVIGFVAWVPGGPRLTVTDNALASPVQIGYFELSLGNQVVMVSELVVFIAFVIIMMVSLLLAAGAIGAVFFGLSRGIANAAVATHTPLERQLFQLPSGAPVAEAKAEATPVAGPPDAVRNLLFVVVFLAAYAALWLLVVPFISDQILATIVPIADDARLFFSISGALALAAGIARPRNILMPLAVYFAIVTFLYPLFYHVLVGLVYTAVFPNLGGDSLQIQRVIVSLLNALIIPLLILRPLWVTRLIGQIAGLLARFLRWVGTVR